jgi:anthranilate synthase component 1
MSRTFPSLEAFAALYRQGKPQVLWTEIVADLETPVSAYLKLVAPGANGFLLESVEGGHTRGRYSIIGMKPDAIWRYRGEKVEINRHALSHPDRFEREDGTPLASMAAFLAESLIELPENLPPMAAGIVGYLGYDTVRLMEKLGPPNPDTLGTPDGMLLRPTVMAIFDSVKAVINLVTPVRPNGLSPEAAYQAAENRLLEALERMDEPVPHMGEATMPPLSDPQSNTSREDYLAMVQKAQDYIRAGDIFQVVLSQRFSLPFALPPFSLYRALRRTNPSPYMFYLDFADFTVVGSSPEILVSMKDEKVTIRPIAGTRTRGRNRAEDEAQVKDLLGDPKELAEHLMLLDLGRNDVGRVAQVGSVTVTEQNIIEYYSHVMHIVSNVEGAVRRGLTNIDVLKAAFPAGTVSGAPKIRAMQIIDELEKEKRGIYAGAVGYFSANGSMDTCIVLRTAIVKDEVMYVQAGAGIVAESRPDSEYEECRAKARALVKAAEEAVRFSDLVGRGQ